MEAQNIGDMIMSRSGDSFLIKRKLEAIMVKEEIDILLKEILDVDEILQPEVNLVDLDAWDSLSILALAAKIKELFNENLTRQKIDALVTVKDLYDYLGEL